MPKITIDGREIECRAGVPVLQAALEAGFEVPHYCYHPGLTVVASCRLCLMEMKMPHPQTKEMGWAPKLFPSCQTPVQDGMEVRFASQTVQQSQAHTLEYYLLNHPLDCPVCDKAGECYLQDYSERFGAASSRMVEDKYKNPKKDIGSKTLLYQDRCVLCTRCVRFANEIAGTGELAVVDRGARAEIDVFPGVPLENELQGNVVELCPVGALLDKDFLFKQRVWLLKETPSVTPADSSGATIWIDHNGNRVYRVRPRFNEAVNEWWISDEQRFCWKAMYDPRRSASIQLKTPSGWRQGGWDELPAQIRTILSTAAHADGGQKVAVVLSPMLSLEEAWLLARFVRGLAPQATLVAGYTPIEGVDKKFPKGFILRAEKAPNRRGVEWLIERLGGAKLTMDEFVAACERGNFSAAYLTGGYLKPWVKDGWVQAMRKVDGLIVHDTLPSGLDDIAQLRIPGAVWAEREGAFMNCDGLLQAFERAVNPPDGLKSDGQFFQELCGGGGLYRGRKMRAAMAAEMADFPPLHTPRPEPKYAH